jgi:hypothetical protein
MTRQNMWTSVRRSSLGEARSFPASLSWEPKHTINDEMHRLESNIQFRKEVVERIGLGFELPSKKVVVGLNGPKRTEVPDAQLVASV